MDQYLENNLNNIVDCYEVTRWITGHFYIGPGPDREFFEVCNFIMNRVPGILVEACADENQAISKKYSKKLIKCTKCSKIKDGKFTSAVRAICINVVHINTLVVINKDNVNSVELDFSEYARTAFLMCVRSFSNFSLNIVRFHVLYFYSEGYIDWSTDRELCSDFARFMDPGHVPRAPIGCEVSFENFLSVDNNEIIENVDIGKFDSFMSRRLVSWQVFVILVQILTRNKKKTLCAVSRMSPELVKYILEFLA